MVDATLNLNLSSAPRRRVSRAAPQPYPAAKWAPRAAKAAVTVPSRFPASVH